MLLSLGSVMHWISPLIIISISGDISLFKISEKEKVDSFLGCHYTCLKKSVGFLKLFSDSPQSVFSHH
jgi:hypothetical protein